MTHHCLAFGLHATIVAILGTTICPYLFFWQAEQEVDEIHRNPEDQPLAGATLAMFATALMHLNS